MYAFQFQDATYRIALLTSRSNLFGTILRNTEAFRLYEGIYTNRQDAEKAIASIKQMVGL